MITAEQIERNREAFRERGRQARRDGLTIADCPCLPYIGPGRPRFGCCEAAEWINGWREEDGRLNDA